MNQQQRAVVQQALDALETEAAIYREADPEDREPEYIWEAITALRQLLEQPVQEPVAWYRDEDGMRIYYDTKCWEDATPLYTTPPAQPTDHSEQHLDMVDHGDELTIAYLDGVHTGKKMAKREWIGLTNEECIEIAARGYPRWLEFAQAVEAKLREKNGGA
jgi:hypothetical protein